MDTWDATTARRNVREYNQQLVSDKDHIAEAGWRGVPVWEVATFMGDANSTTTEHIYTHLFDTDDHAGAMAELNALDHSVLAEGNSATWVARTRCTDHGRW